MVVVTALNIVVVIFAYLARFDKKRYLLAWGFTLLVIVLGIRYGYGNDYFNYKYIFDNGYSEGGRPEDMEPGWLLINKLLWPLGFSSFVFFLTALEHIMLYDVIRRYVSPNYYWLAVFIYLFNPYFMLIGLSMMRQFLVQILGIYAVEYAYKKKLIPFVLIVLICVSIHKVGYLLFPLIFLPRLLESSSSKSLFILSSVILLGMIYIATKMDVVIDILIELFTESDMKYGDSYLNDDALSEELQINPKLIIRYALYVILLIRSYKYLPNTNPSKLFAVEVAFGLLFLPFAQLSPMAIRVSWIFSVVVIIVMPILVKYEKVAMLKYGIILIFSSLLLRDYYNHFFSEIYGAYYMNYHTIFSEYAINNIRLY